MTFGTSCLQTQFLKDKFQKFGRQAQRHRRNDIGDNSQLGEVQSLRNGWNPEIAKLLLSRLVDQAE